MRSPVLCDGQVSDKPKLLPPTAVWLESSLSTRRFIVAMIIS
jgi:hypothetical protein